MRPRRLAAAALLSGARCRPGLSGQARCASSSPGQRADRPTPSDASSAQKLSESTGQQWIIDNRGGATGTIGHAFAAKAPPDGYTLLLGTNSTFAIAPHLYKNLQYDNEKSFAPVSLVAISPQILSVHPSLPVKKREGADRARQGEARRNPVLHRRRRRDEPHGDRASHEHGGHQDDPRAVQGRRPVGPGADRRRNRALVRRRHHCPAPGTGRPAAPDRDQHGQAHALMPELPTIAESGLPGFESVTSFGMFAPAGTAQEIVTRVNREVARALAAADVKDKLRAQGIDPAGTAPEELVAHQKQETAKWGKVIREQGIKFE